MKITQINLYIPPRVLTNEELAERLNVDPEWIYRRSGIKTRFISNLSIVEMGLKAAEKLDLYGVDTVLFVSSRGAHYVPYYFSAFKDLKIKNPRYGIDISNGFVGFITALHVADVMYKDKIAKGVLIIISEKLSDLVDPMDSNTAILFSDIAVAMTLEPINNCACDHEVIYDPNYLNALNMNENGKIVMDGKRVYRFAVKSMKDMVDKYLKKGYLNDPILVPHQANARILKAVAKELKNLKVIDIIEKYGNTGAASIPTALYEYYNGKPVELLNHLLISVGGGMTAGGIAWRCEE